MHENLIKHLPLEACVQIFHCNEFKEFEPVRNRQMLNWNWKCV